MAKSRDTTLIIARNFRPNGNKQLAGSFIASLLSKMEGKKGIKTTVLSYGDVDEHTGGTDQQAAPWPDQSTTSLGSDLLDRAVSSTKIIREVIRLLPELKSVHWLEPLAPWNAALAYFLKSRGVPSYMTLFSLHNRYPAHYRLLAMTLAGLEKVIVTTTGLSQALSQNVGLDLSKIMKIPLGVNLELFRPCKDKANAKKRLGIDPDTRVFSWFGPIEPSTPNDLRAVLSAGQMMHEKFPRSCLLLAFKNRVREPTGADASWLKRYHDLDHIRDILDATDAVVLPFSRPSWRKGLPLTVIESLASGVPVITTVRGGLDEVIEHGSNGLLVEDTEEIPQAVLSLCESELLLAEMSRNARRVAEDRFDLETSAQAYADLWGR